MSFSTALSSSHSALILSLILSAAPFSDSVEWKDKKFRGIIEESGRDHILLSDPTNGKWYMILMIYVDFIEFDERINYEKI